MNKVNFNETQSQKIKRTICIGLGGTGKDVLMRIRRLIVDRYGDLSELPVVSFVHIDTDKSGSNVSGLKTGNIYHGVDLSFRDAEKVAATMTRMEVDNFTQELNRRSSDYEGSSGVYKHIESWFPPQLLKDLKTIDEGAQGIRPVGRLAFFHNYRQIKNAIETAEKRTRGHEANLIRKGLQVENQLNIFVVGSLCGGTGSGIFLDVAYSLRRNYGDNGAQIFGYLVISPELYGNNPSMNANTYAALKELNYYATAGTKFEACYDQQNLEYVQESRPPFEYVYLVSNRTAGDYKILEKSKLCNIIAHKIALDFASELAPVIAGHRDNFLLQMIRCDEHPRPNVQRYLTFGLAEIYFPRDAAVQISLNRIKIKLIQFWLEGEGQSPDTQVLLERFLRIWYPEQGKKDGFLSKLQEATTDGSKTFSSWISGWRNRLEQTIVECKTGDERQQIIGQLSRDVREQFRKVQPGETESIRGIWLTNLEQIGLRLKEQLQQDIDRFLAGLLNPNHSDFAIASSRAWLEALTTELNKYHRELEDKLSAAGQLNRLEDIEKKWKDKEQIINDLEQKRSLPLFNKQKKNSEFQEEAKRAVSQIDNLIKHNFNFASTQQALEIIRGLQQHVRDLITQTSNFYNLVKSLQNTYQKIDRDLQQFNLDEMSGEAIFAEADTDYCYQDLLPEKERASQLALVSNKITEKIGMEDSLASCLTKNLLDEPQLQEQIDLIVDGLFGSRSLSTIQSAVKRFLENYSLSDRSVRLEQIIKEAKPLLPLNTSDPYFYNDSRKSADIIAFKDTDTKEVAQFKILFKDLGIPDSYLKPIQAEDEIIIVSEYGGFPLRIVDGLEQMRQHYIRDKNYGNVFLHNDYRIPFTDIIPPDAREMKQLQDILYPALAFKLLPYNSQTKTYQFQYYDNWENTYVTASLNYSWDEALEQLVNLKYLAKALTKQLHSTISDIERDCSLWEKKYLPKLREFRKQIKDLPKEDPNYLYKEIVIGKDEEHNSPSKEGIIDRFRRKIEKLCSSQPLTLPSESGSGKSLPGTNIENEVNNQPPKYHHNLVMDADFSDSEPISIDKEDIEEKLRKLIQLKAKGLITEESYKAKEKEYLDLL